MADYLYLGLGTVVQQDSPQASLRYTLIDLVGSYDPDTGDIYAGLDRFSRIKDLRLRSTSTNTDLSRIRYGYDRASSRIWRENPSDTNRHYDWLYSNDGMHRLHDAQRGQLNAGHTAITSPQFGQCWTLDETGNWQGFRQDDDGNGSWDLIQARTSNPVNEITDIDNTAGPSWSTTAYDANGNTTSIPRPDLGTNKAMFAIWDAWNRLVKLVNPDLPVTDPPRNSSLFSQGVKTRASDKVLQSTRSTKLRLPRPVFHIGLIIEPQPVLNCWRKLEIRQSKNSFDFFDHTGIRNNAMKTESAGAIVSSFV